MDKKLPTVCAKNRARRPSHLGEQLTYGLAKPKKASLIPGYKLLIRYGETIFLMSYQEAAADKRKSHSNAVPLLRTPLHDSHLCTSCARVMMVDKIAEIVCYSKANMRVSQPMFRVCTQLEAEGIQE